MVSKTLFSSERMDWRTPQWLFDSLNSEFGFTLDVAASSTNTKCKSWYDEAKDALSQPWHGVCWCNPPYGRTIERWVEKAVTECLSGNATTVVMLLPSRTDTKWFHKWCLPYGELRFLSKRLCFDDSGQRAPFPSLVVVFKKPTPK